MLLKLVYYNLTKMIFINKPVIFKEESLLKKSIIIYMDLKRRSRN